MVAFRGGEQSSSLAGIGCDRYRVGNTLSVSLDLSALMRAGGGRIQVRFPLLTTMGAERHSPLLLLHGALSAPLTAGPLPGRRPRMLLRSLQADDTAAPPPPRPSDAS